MQEEQGFNPEKAAEQFVPETTQIPPEYIELWDKHNRVPVEEDTWNEVIDLARKEERTEISGRGIYGQIPLDNLLSLAEKVRSEPDPVERYRLLAKESPTGQIWFEVLDGLRSDLAIDAMDRKVGERNWDNGLDIGTGCGVLSEKIEGYCNRLVAVDRADFLLKLGKMKAFGGEEFITGEALHLPFSNQSFDLVVSSGLTASFDKDQLEDFVSELARVIRPQGSYLEATQMPPESGDLHPEHRRSLANAKGILADMIVDETSGKSKIGDHLKLTDYVSTFQSKGFSFEYSFDQDKNALVLEFVKVI